MKKILVVAMMALSFVANAQSIKFGPKIGLNISDFRDSEKGSDMQTSFVVEVVWLNLNYLINSHYN